MREKLVSYLLGELDATEAAELEARLEADPKLREQLERLRSCMDLQADGLEERSQGGEQSTLETAEGVDPPSGLADRTADSVHDLVIGLKSDSAGHPAVDSAVEAPGRLGNFTFVDATVAAGVVMAGWHDALSRVNGKSRGNAPHSVRVQPSPAWHGARIVRRGAQRRAAPHFAW